MPTEITLEEVQDRIKGLPSETQRAVVCALVGHSRIKDTFWGYMYCGRCEAQVGDTLGGAYSTKEDVIIGHNCETCRLNYQALTWRDTFMVEDPFQEKVGLKHPWRTGEGDAVVIMQAQRLAEKGENDSDNTD